MIIQIRFLSFEFVIHAKTNMNEASKFRKQSYNLRNEFSNSFFLHSHFVFGANNSANASPKISVKANDFKNVLTKSFSLVLMSYLFTRKCKQIIHIQIKSTKFKK